MLRALAADYGEAARTVLRCSATESESHLPFLALADLFGLVLDEVSGPVARRAAHRPGVGAHRPRRVHAAARRTRPAAGRPVRAARARRRGPRADRRRRPPVAGLRPAPNCSASPPAGSATPPSGMLCAVRTRTGQEYDRHLRASPPDTLAVRLNPLSRTQVSALLDHRGYTGLPRSTVRDIHRTSGGNPLFALELGRALGREPRRRRAPASRCRCRPRCAPWSSAAWRCSPTRPAAPCWWPAPAPAPRWPCCTRPAGRTPRRRPPRRRRSDCWRPSREAPAVRFAHPLISAALYAEAPAQERRAAHAALSTAASDPIERARHLALATTGTDPEVAARLAEAAAAGPGPGRALGGRLARAARRPAHPGRTAGPARTNDRLRAAEDAITAGEPDLARDIAREVLTRATVPADRVRAWMVVIDAAGQAIAEVDAVFPQALADAGDDPRLLALVRYQLAWRALLVEGDFAEARRGGRARGGAGGAAAATGAPN